MPVPLEASKTDTGPDFYRSIGGNIRFAEACSGNAWKALPS
jgi:hypothetical protein